MRLIRLSIRSGFATLAMLSLLARAPVALAVDAPVIATTKKKSTETRKSVFSLGVDGQRRTLKAGDGNEVLGNGAGVQLGTGYVSDTWYLLTSLDILLGPYEPTRDKQIDVDFVGTGLTFWSGFSAQGLDLRSPEGGYGFALGLSYADIVGRSLGRNRLEKFGNESANDGLIDDYVIRVTDFSILPALFFGWLESPRPEGNTPELLKTRLEGYFLTLGLAMPLLVSYQAKYSRRAADGSAEAVQEKGRLRGYTIHVTLTALLGT